VCLLHTLQLFSKQLSLKDGGELIIPFLNNKETL
jgi:hypothetical protein